MHWILLHSNYIYLHIYILYILHASLTMNYLNVPMEAKPRFRQIIKPSSYHNFVQPKVVFKVLASFQLYALFPNFPDFMASVS